MKRITLLLALLLCLCAAPHALAVSDEAQQAAESLNRLGLFLGTGFKDGQPVFDLDKIPTRNQAVIMLVRLLGKEQEAVSGNWDIPFKDVRAGSVTAPYIGYAYAHGLTKGTTATTYSGTNSVTRNQYLLFLMRAMGYDDSQTDEQGMTTAGAAVTSKLLGLLVGLDEGQFTRGDVAVLSNRALDTYMRYNKPKLQTLREALGLGTSPQWNNKPVPLDVPARHTIELDNETLKPVRETQSIEDIKTKYIQTPSTPIDREIPVPSGEIISFAWYTPHGTTYKLIHAFDDGRLLNLYLPALNNWGETIAPKNLTYHENEGTVTYDVEVPNHLEWSVGTSFARMMGIYRFTYRVADHTETVTYSPPMGHSSVGAAPTPIVSVDDCLKQVTGIYRDGEPVTVTSADCVYSEVMRQIGVVNRAEWFPLGNVPAVPEGQENRMVWLIAADVTGRLGGLPGPPIENPRVTIVADAETGELLSESYAARNVS